MQPRRNSFALSRASRSNEIREIIPLATMSSIAMAANAAGLSIVHADTRGFYDNFIHA
jgi:hypothetical protein